MPNAEITIELPTFPDLTPAIEGFAEGFAKMAQAATKAMRQFADACHGLRSQALGLYDLSTYRGPPLRVKLARKVLRHPERYDDRMIQRARYTAFRIHNRMMIRVFKSSPESTRELLLFGGAGVVINTRKSRRWPI